MSELLTLAKPLELQYNEKVTEKPNLPEGEVKLVAISEAAGESKLFLNSLGIRTVDIQANPQLSESVSSHADIRLLHLPNKRLYSYIEEINSFSNLQFFTVSGVNYKISPNYPDDVRLNCSIIGNKIICNKRTVAKEILEFAEIEKYQIIDTKQGYSRCSVCIINENAIITDDPSIFKAAQNFFNDTLFISKGSIGLKAASYGFIGGCTGKLSKNKIAFNGRIESHTDHNRIIDLLNKYNITAIELTGKKLEDIGGIIPLTEAAQ